MSKSRQHAKNRFRHLLRCSIALSASVLPATVAAQEYGPVSSYPAWGGGFPSYHNTIPGGTAIPFRVPMSMGVPVPMPGFPIDTYCLDRLEIPSGPAQDHFSYGTITPPAFEIHHPAVPQNDWIIQGELHPGMEIPYAAVSHLQWMQESLGVVISEVQPATSPQNPISSEASGIKTATEPDAASLPTSTISAPSFSGGEEVTDVADAVFQAVKEAREAEALNKQGDSELPQPATSPQATTVPIEEPSIEEPSIEEPSIDNLPVESSPAEPELKTTAQPEASDILVASVLEKPSDEISEVKTSSQKKVTEKDTVNEPRDIASVEAALESKAGQRLLELIAENAAMRTKLEANEVIARSKMEMIEMQSRMQIERLEAKLDDRSKPANNPELLDILRNNNQLLAEIKELLARQPRTAAPVDRLSPPQVKQLREQLDRNKANENDKKEEATERRPRDIEVMQKRLSEMEKAAAINKDALRKAVEESKTAQAAMEKAKILMAQSNEAELKAKASESALKDLSIKLKEVTQQRDAIKAEASEMQKALERVRKEVSSASTESAKRIEALNRENRELKSQVSRLTKDAEAKKEQKEKPEPKDKPANKKAQNRNDEKADKGKDSVKI